MEHIKTIKTPLSTVEVYGDSYHSNVVCVTGCDQSAHRVAKSMATASMVAGHYYEYVANWYDIDMASIPRSAENVCYVFECERYSLRYR